jgi:plasmid stabilization system protein ParE
MAGRTVEFHPFAAEEAAHAVAGYALRSSVAARAFLTELERSVHQVSESPRSFPQCMLGARRIAFRRFPFMLVHREVQFAIQVIAVAHRKRKPGYWRGR